MRIFLKSILSYSSVVILVTVGDFIYCYLTSQMYKFKSNTIMIQSFAACIIILFDLIYTMKEDRIKDSKELGPWLSAALSDEKVCKEFKEVIENWFKKI